MDEQPPSQLNNHNTKIQDNTTLNKTDTIGSSGDEGDSSPGGEEVKPVNGAPSPAAGTGGSPAQRLSNKAGDSGSVPARGSAPVKVKQEPKEGDMKVRNALHKSTTLPVNRRDCCRQ